MGGPLQAERVSGALQDCIMRGINMNLSFGQETIYEDAEFSINKRDKVGVVGVNGAGKTTLFQILLGRRNLDSGHISVGNARIGYLPQEITLSAEHIPVLEYLLEGRPIRKLETELHAVCARLETAAPEEQAPLLARMAKLQSELEYHECYEAENILLRIIDSMGIDFDLLDRRLAELSGGQKSKIAFARTLYSRPEVLLLDEPTNHLDASSRAFVMTYLKEYDGMVLIISHDTAFLNQVVNRVMFINKATRKISMYDGDYDAYRKKYALEQRLREQCIARREMEIGEMAALVLRAKQASPTNHRLKSVGKDRAARLEKKREALQPREREYRRVSIRINPKREGAGIPLEVENLTFGYPGRPPLFHHLSFKLAGRERFLVAGENGVGKSTLLKLLTGVLPLQSGEIRFNPKTDTAYYAQELEILDAEKSILENVDGGGCPEHQLRAILGNFLFPGAAAFKKVGVLSPGEKARVALCKVLLAGANMLFLDEPTNHLDPDTQAIIGENFNSYAGTIMTVSHNPAFIERIGITRVLVLPSGRIENYSPAWHVVYG